MLDLLRRLEHPDGRSGACDARRRHAPDEAPLRDASCSFKASNGDPFASQLAGRQRSPAGAVSRRLPERTTPSSPRRRLERDAVSSPAPAPEPAAPAAPEADRHRHADRRTPSRSDGWIVVLASIQTRVGRRYAETLRDARAAQRPRPVAVLDSSTRKPLRAGYYVVYTGPFATLSASPALRSPCARLRLQDRVRPRDPPLLGSMAMASRLRDEAGIGLVELLDRDGRDEHRHLRARRRVQLRLRTNQPREQDFDRRHRSPTSRWRTVPTSGSYAVDRLDRLGSTTTTGPDGRTYWIELRRHATCSRGLPARTRLDPARLRAHA